MRRLSFTTAASAAVSGAVAAVALTVASAAFAPAHATVILADDFNKEPLALNATSFIAAWMVKNGSVDIHGQSDYWDVHPGNGRYVDLDGSTLAGGTLTQALTLDAGVTYAASFWLGGSGRGDSNTVDVSFGATSASYTLASGDALAPVAPLIFTPELAGSYELSFQNRGGDNLGAILDNVVVQNVPEPSTLALVLGAAGLMTAARRRRQR